MNKKDAVRLFASRDFENIPQALVMKAYPYAYEEIEVLAPTYEDWLEENGEDYEDLDDALEAFQESEDASPIPMWATYFHATQDRDWIWKNASEVWKKTGFIVYDIPDVGICLGVNGAGYSFYDTHWLRLYDLRGLQWHDEE